MARKRYRRWQPPDIYADLGPGDPGYRLRPGKTGFDPIETYAEYGRVIGLLMKSVVTGRLGPVPGASLFLLWGLAFLFGLTFLGRLDPVIGGKFWYEFVYATIGGFYGLLVWVALRALLRGIRSLLP